MPEYNQMSLRESAKSDHMKGLKQQLTGWGKVSADRNKRGISRKARRKTRNLTNNEIAANNQKG